MENFIVSARKYRPLTFESVVGQASITRTLKNAINKKQLAHAYLFCGPRGIGKTTCARIFAKTINCEHLSEKVEACGKCESCLSFSESRSYNIHELDAASNNSVEDIRNLTDQVRIPPQVGKYSIYIIDEVHMLSQQAFNAFLKTLEEPPPHAIFILATTEKHKIIPTILSRCQIFDFNRISINDIVGYLEYISKNENITYEKEAFNIIAQKVDGAMRDALSIFDQIISFSGSNITYKEVIENLNVLDYEYFFNITDSIINNNVQETLLIFAEILDKGFDAHNFINNLSKHFRNLLLIKDQSAISLLDVGKSLQEKYILQTQKCPEDFLFKILEISNNCDMNYRLSKDKRLHVEIFLIQLCNITSQKKKLTDNEKKSESQEKSVAETNINFQEQKIGPLKHNKINPDEITQPSKEYKRNTPSIKEALNHNSPQVVAENKDVDKEIPIDEIENSDNYNFSNEELNEKWLIFAENFKKSKPRMYSTLKKQLPQLKEEYKIEVIMNNTDQKEDFMKDIKFDLITFLKKELKNSKIDISIYQDKKEESGKRLYTAEEKFEHMSQKNPVLSKLKKDFNLDYE